MLERLQEKKDHESWLWNARNPAVHFRKATRDLSQKLPRTIVETAVVLRVYVKLSLIIFMCSSQTGSSPALFEMMQWNLPSARLSGCDSLQRTMASPVFQSSHKCLSLANLTRKHMGKGVLGNAEENSERCVSDAKLTVANSSQLEAKLPPFANEEIT